MDSFIERVGLTKHTAISIFFIAAILVIFCESAMGQTPKMNTEVLGNDSTRGVAQKILGTKDSDIAFYRGHPLHFKTPWQNYSSRPFNRSFVYKHNKSKGKEFFLEMNRKMDSAWKKFDQRCRERNRLETHAEDWNIFH